MRKNVLMALVAILLAFDCHVAGAQSVAVNKKFGAVSMDELKMTTYQLDTSAAAVLLYTSETRFFTSARGYMQLVIKNHRRIKILKEEGKSAADFEIRLNVGRHPEDTYGALKVVTYNIENNKVEQTKLERSHVYESKLDDSYMKVNFAAENVKVGSVIEAQWETCHSFRGYMPDMILQSSIPVNFGQMEVSMPVQMVITASMQGIDCDRCTFRRENDATNTVDTYVVKDMPAFKSEPKVVAPYQYVTKGIYTSKFMPRSTSERRKDNSWLKYGTYRLHGVSSGESKRFLNTNWSSIDKDLAKSSIFKTLYGPCRYSKEVEDIISRDLSEEETIACIREMVLGKIKWNDEIDLYPDPDIFLSREVVGTNADINAQMGNCLRKAGFTVSPVILKLRSSGKINRVSGTEYDTFVLCARSSMSNAIYFFDAADPAGYLNVLPEDMLVTEGRLITENGEGGYVDLSRLTTNTEAHQVHSTLTAEGDLNVTANIRFKGASSYNFKSMHNSFHGDDEKFLDVMQEILNGYTLDSCEIVSGKDWSGSIEIKLNLSQSFPSGDSLIAVNPFIVQFFSSDTFKSETRKLPVEFAYPEDIRYYFDLSIPEGYTLEQMPHGYSIVYPELECLARMMCGQSGESKFNMQYTLKMGKNFVDVSGYPRLRVFWGEMCSGYKDRVMIRRK